MGRYSTGATTVDAAQRLEMSYLLKRGFFKCFGDKFGSHTQSISWTSGSSISIETVHTPKETYLRLFYTITSNRTGEKTEMNYKIQIERKPSNLGKGYILYFRCPVSDRLSRILYRAYGSHYFKAREAYKPRLYYEAQQSSKKFALIDRFNTVRWKVEASWESQRRNQTTYKGKPTKYSLNLEKMKQKYFELEDKTELFIMANIYK